MTSDFVHLHVHTEYSLLDGQSQIRKLVERARQLEMSALGITDHGVMFGVIDFYKAATDAGIKPVIGMEAYLAPRGMTDRDPTLDKRPYHMLLLAQNMTGYRNLMRIASAAQLEGYYYRPRIDKDFLAAHAEGIIATSGCLAAEIPRMVEEGLDDRARDLIGWYQEVFGPDRFFLELQGHDIEQLHVLNRWLIDYRQSGHTPVELLATNDVHYVLQSDWEAHDTLLCIQTGARKAEENRMRMSPQTSYYLKSAAEMRADFAGAPQGLIREAFANSLRIAEMTDLNLETKGYHLPIFPVPAGFTTGTYLRYLVDMGLSWRFPGREDDPILQKRIERELDIIGTAGFDTYFLIVWDLCEFARSADIWWNVRGSGAGSLVAYCLGITSIDPIQNNLLFERFLNPGRVSMPDIDLDYPDDRRSEMIAYAAQKYGEDKVAAIITFGTMGAKAAVRDVGRALDVELSRINRAVSMIPTEAKQKPIREYIAMNPELKALYQADEQIREVMDTAIALQGLTRHASTHAAGVIIADRRLDDYIPLHRITGTDPSGGSLKAVTQFPMETAESIGLLKVDFLGLSTLTIMRKACELIAQHQGVNYNMENIPYRHDDPSITDEERRRLDAAFDMMGRGETIGVFQVESGGMQQMLRGMRPHRFEHIIAGISLYRPGPMEFIPQYNRRLHGEEEAPYLHEKLKPILEETYGIIVYQEQIMQIAGELFGYELGQADLMRRAVSKKKTKDLMEHKAIFIERGPENGVSAEVAEKIFNEIEFFANYGFNKSHASDYAVITVQTAYLKCHYPEEYMTALLCVQFDDSAKVATFLEECKRLQIPVLPPDINYSQVDFDIERMKDGRRAIRFGLGAIKNAGVMALQRLLEERRAGGPFASLEDLCHRIDLREIGRRALESLIKVGAVSFAPRDALLENLDRVISFSTAYHKARKDGQMSLFGQDAFGPEGLEIAPAREPVPNRDQLRWEKELLGLYVTGRPIDKHRDKFRYAANLIDLHLLKEQADAYNEQPVRLVGEVMSLRRILTRNNDNMAVLMIEDWHESAGTIEVVAFPRIWGQVERLCQAHNGRELEEGDIVRVEGKVDTTRGDVQIIADKINFDFDFFQAEEGDFVQIAPVAALAYDDDPAPPAWMMAGVSQSSSLDYDEETGELIRDVAEPVPTEAPEIVVPASHSVAPVPDTVPQFGATHDAHEVDEAEDLPPWGGELLGISLFDEEEESLQRHVVVSFQRTAKPDADRRKLRHIHDLLISYPGRDTFEIIILGKPKPVRMRFPGHHTQVCKSLFSNLAKLGEDVTYELAEAETSDIAPVIKLP